MKIEHERAVLEAMYLAKLVSGELYLRKNEISILTGIIKSSLQRILPRLIKRGWVEEKSVLSYSKWTPRGKVGQLEWVWLIDSKRNKRKALLPKEILDEYQEKLLKLTRTKTERSIDWTKITKAESYLDVVKQMNQRKQYRVLRQNSLPFRGRRKLWKNLLDKETPKQEYTFYKLLVFPYIFDRRIGGHMKSNQNDKVFPRWNDVPKKYENYWREAAQELKKIIKWIKTT